MSCGFPSVQITLPFPDIDLPSVPSLLDLPDFSWLADLLGIDLSALLRLLGLDGFGLPLPEVDLPKPPNLPELPDFSWMVDLGLPALSFDINLPIPEVDLPSPPELPDLLDIDCPFDD